MFLSLFFLSCEKDSEVIDCGVSINSESITSSYTAASVVCDFYSNSTLENVYIQYAKNNSFANYQEKLMDRIAGKHVVCLSNLEPNTNYYLRYVFRNRYSSISPIKRGCLTTTSSPSVPIVITDSAREITRTSVIIGGKVVSDGGDYVTRCGIVYSCYPDMYNQETLYADLQSKDSFEFNISDLQAGTVYYFRTFAINQYGTTYGEIISFTTNEFSSVSNAAKFSVSKKHSVLFSKGNLQYNGKNGSWRFAEKQTDYIGKNNLAFYEWRDLFGWSANKSEVAFGLSYSENEYTYLGSFVDWGVNEIDGYAPNTWRTLTKSEWKYILYDRENAVSLRRMVYADNVYGLMLLPDNWESPQGLKGYQSFSAEQWSVMENNGAVFLPAAGVRWATYSVSSVQEVGCYWSASNFTRSHASFLYFSSSEVDVTITERDYGQSVRLVKDL